MRKTFQSRRWLAALLTLALVMSLAPVALAANETITLSESYVELKAGSSTRLLATTTGDSGPYTINWESSNTDIATVTSDGTVTAKAEGTATITAKINGINVSAQCTVKVTQVELEIVLNQSTASLEMTSGSEMTISVSVERKDRSQFTENAQYTYYWQSRDSNVVTVKGNNQGTSTVRPNAWSVGYDITIVAKEVTSETTANIDLRVAGDGFKGDTKQITVKVKPRTASKAEIRPESASLKIGDTVKLEASLDVGTPSSGWTWNSTDPGVATVNNGVVTAIGKGTTKITAIGNGFTGEATITVAEPGITFDPPTLSLKIGEEKTVKVTANNLPNGEWKNDYTGTNVSITQKNLNGTSSELTVKGLKATSQPEEVPIRYKYGNDKKERGILEVTVVPLDLTVTCDTEGALSGNTINLTQYQVITLEASTDVDFEGGGSWSWELSNGSYLGVSPSTNSATITANNEGTNAKIKVKYTSTADNTNYVEKDFTVNVTKFKPPTVSLNPTTLTVEGGTEATIKATLDQKLSGTWNWIIDPVTVNGITYSGDNTDTLKITAAPDVENTTLFIKAQYTVPGVSNPYESSQCRVTVKEADHVLTLDPKTLAFDVLRDNEKPVEISITQGNKPLTQNAEVTFNRVLKDAQGRAVAEIDVPGSEDEVTLTILNGKGTLQVKPVGTGTATLTVTHEYSGNGQQRPVTQDSCAITVTGPSLRITPTDAWLDLVENKTVMLNAVLDTGEAVDKSEIRWESKDPKIADITYDQSGNCIVMAKKEGSTTITATYKMATDKVAGTITAKCPITVGNYHFSINPSGALTLEPNQHVTIKATTRQMNKEGKTEDITSKQKSKISWQLSDGMVARFEGIAPGVLQVQGTDQVTIYNKDNATKGPVKVTATWTLKSGKTYTDTLDITFADPEPESLVFTISPTAIQMKTGEEKENALTAGTPTVKWKDGKNRSIAAQDVKYAWSSSDSSIVRVDASGKLTALKAGTAKITATATGTVNGTAVSGRSTNECTVTVSVDTTIKSLKLSANSVTLEVGGSQTITATTDPAGAAVAWTTSDAKVVTVNNGVITAVKPGKATVTATAGGFTQTVDVTVNGFEQLLDEITVIEGKTVSATTIFTAHGAAAGRNPTYSSLDPTIASYANGNIVGNKVGNTSITIRSGTYYITVKVTVVADAASTIQLPTMYTQTQPILRFRDFIARFRDQAGGNLSHITGLNLDTAKGTLYYNYVSASEPGSGVGADSYYLSPSVGQRGIEDITFVPKPNYSGRVTINYTAVSTGGQNYVCSIVFDVDPGSGSSSGLNLSTAYNTPLKFNGADFNRVCQDRLGVRLDYVTFSQPSSQQGTLYTNYIGAGNYGSVVSGSSQYTTKALDDVWFVPAPGYSGSVTVYYTGYGVGGASYSGQVNISVGWENNVAIAGITYDINRGGVAYFDDFKFSSYCRQVLDSSKSLSHIRFSSLPASGEGVLYYNYNSSSRTQASTGTNYYYSSTSPYIDRLAFAAASGFTGTVKIPFTGWTTDGVSFTGNVEINVQSSGSSGTAGDILYICGAGQTVYFDDTDFNALSRSRTGSSLNYITLNSLPGSSYGSVYYNNTRASTSTSYRNGNSTPRIDNLSFRASSSFYGAVDIPFTGRATNGETFRGVITVATSSSAVNNGSTNASQTVFTDMAGYSASQQAAVNYLYEHNITRGMTTTQFGPQNSIRRGDFARMVYQAFDLTPSASSRPFQDVPSTAYYAQAVNALYSRGIVSGIGGGLYNPDGTLTRQDAVCMVQRAMRAVGWSADDGSLNSLYRYSDGGTVSGYAQGAMAFAVDRGILPTGGSWLNPTQPLTRVDMAEIIYRVLANSSY